jgi:hypothetical protein
MTTAQEQVQFNPVFYQIDKNGPGGSGTHDLTSTAAAVSVQKDNKFKNPRSDSTNLSFDYPCFFGL